MKTYDLVMRDKKIANETILKIENNTFRHLPTKIDLRIKILSLELFLEQCIVDAPSVTAQFDIFLRKGFSREKEK